MRGLVDQGGVYSRHGRLHGMSLVSNKSNIESIALVAVNLDYVPIIIIITLPHLNGDDRIGFLCQFNVYAGLKIAFLYSITYSNIILICTVRPFAGGHLEYLNLLKCPG